MHPYSYGELLKVLSTQNMLRKCTFKYTEKSELDHKEGKLRNSLQNMYNNIIISTKIMPNTNKLYRSGARTHKNSA